MNIRRINKKLSLISACLVLFAGLGLYLALGRTTEDTMQDRIKEPQLQSPFGVLAFLHWNHPWNSFKYPDRGSLEKAARLMNEAGISMVRLDFLWEDIEPKEGAFNFEKYDLIVDLLSNYNIRILGILDYCALWAAECGEWNCAPKDNRLFVDYAVRVIGRYKDKVKYWEVWNEPDSPAYWLKQDGLKSYCALLKDVYLAAKLVDPDCKVLNGGLALGLSSVNLLYDNGAGKYFDILNIHIFENPLAPGRLNGVSAYPKLARKVMDRHGDSVKEIWVTEIGCPGVRKDSNAANWWIGSNPDEKQQAEWLKDVFTVLLDQKIVSKIFWAFFRDCDSHWGNGVDYFGLLRWDFSPKPAYYSYKECFENWKKSLSSAVK